MKAIFPLSLLAIASPAWAASGAQVPEPSNMALFALGLAGLIIGRQVAKNKRHRDDK